MQTVRNLGMVAAACAVVLPAPAHASNLSPASLRLDRLKAGVTTGMTVTLTPHQVAGINEVAVTLPGGFALDDTPEISIGAQSPGVTPLPGSLSVARSGQSYIVSGGDLLTPGTRYGFNIDTITNPVTGSYVASIATRGDGGVIEAQGVGFTIVANDQVGAAAAMGTSCSLSADLTGDCYVGIFDLSILLSNYNTTSSRADVNGDGRVNIFDLSIMLSSYGKRS